MDKELIQIYENPDYPVCVNFIERKKEEAVKAEWVYRKKDLELIIVNNGELRVSVSDRVYRAGAGKGLIINSGVRHRIASSEREDTAFFSVVFSPDFVMDISPENSLAQKYFYVTSANRQLEIISMDEDNLRDEAALDKINDIIAANTIKKNGYEIQTKAYLCLLWGILLDYVATSADKVSGVNVLSQDELRVRSAVAYMEENFADPITLEDIANKIHVSRNECCRCFKRVLMVTPIDYLIRLRVFEAAKAIYKEPLSVETFSELGFRTGFNNTSYFNRMFKRYLECTPSEFSKMLKTDSDKARKLYDNLQESITGI